MCAMAKTNRRPEMSEGEAKELLTRVDPRSLKKQRPCGVALFAVFLAGSCNEYVLFVSPLILREVDSRHYLFYWLLVGICCMDLPASWIALLLIKTK